MKNPKIATFLASLLLATPVAADPLPNIIFVLIDDQGWGDMGYNGHPHILTPNIDTMASSGIRFDRFYAGASTCSPSRAAMLIGRSNRRVNIGSPMSRGQGSMPREEVTLPIFLRSKGYHSAQFGKWHVGELQDDPTNIHRYTPGMAGFDYWVTTRNVLPTRDPYTSGKYIDDFYWDNGSYISQATQAALAVRPGSEPGVDTIYREDLEGDDSRIVMDQALRYLETRVTSSQPFFAHICLHAMHTPLVKQTETAGPYETAGLDNKLVIYFSNVTAIDVQVGRLRSWLQTNGLANNTMLWLFSDNGPNIKSGNPVHVSPTDPNFTYTQTGSSGPYKGKKGQLHEGGIRVPGVLEWPAFIPTGFSTDYPVGMIDLVPTILDLVGIAPAEFLPPGRIFDGISVRPVLEGTTGLRRPTALPFKNDGWQALIHHDYKIVKPKGSDIWELYDVESDPYETTQLQDVETAKFAELLLVNCFLRPGFLEAEGPGKVGVQTISVVAPPKIGVL